MNCSTVSPSLKEAWPGLLLGISVTRAKKIPMIEIKYVGI